MAKPPEEDPTKSTIVSLFKSLAFSPDGAKGKKLIDACRRGDLEEVTSLLKSGIKPDHRTKSWTPLIAASEWGHLNIVKALLAAKADINLTSKEPRTALHVASNRGHVQVATELVKNGARVNALDEMGHTPLHRACFEGHKEVVQFLIEEGADVNKQGYDGSTSLHQASSEGHVEIVEMLLASKAKTSLLLKDWERSALHIASMGGHTDLINILLHAGLDINQTDKNFMTSLIFATIQGHTQAVKFLIKSGAKLNEYNKDGMTALLYAAKKDMFEVADILVAADADVNMQERRGWSAIFFAAQKGNRAMVKLLVEAGADVEIINKKGQSVFDVKVPDPLVHGELLLAKGPAEHQKSVEKSGKVSCFTSSHEYPAVTFFLNPWKESVTSEGASILWTDIGVEFDIPRGAVPKGEELQLSVWPTMTGPYSLPEDCSLASPVYLIKPAFEFLCDITVKIYHFCCLETEQQCEDMFFISSPLIPSVVEDIPQYKFKVLSKGSFEPLKTYGSVSLRHFCYKSVSKRKRKRSGSEPEEQSSSSKRKRKKDEPVSNSYQLQMFEGTQKNVAVFSAYLDSPLYNGVAKELLQKLYPDARFRSFSRSKGELCESEMKLSWSEEEGWEVHPDKRPCEISKDVLDSPMDPKLEEYPPFIKLMIEPVWSILSYRRKPYVKIDVLGLSKVHQYTVTTRTTGLEMQPHMDYAPYSLETMPSNTYGAMFHPHYMSPAPGYPSPPYVPLMPAAYMALPHAPGSLSPPYSPPQPMAAISPPPGSLSPPWSPPQHISAMPPAPISSTYVPQQPETHEASAAGAQPFIRADDRPNLVILNTFPHPHGNINILVSAQCHHRMLDNILLNSQDGAQVKALEIQHKMNLEYITYDIFQKWLQFDKEATWRKLVHSLRHASTELNTLAKDIEDCLQ